MKKTALLIMLLTATFTVAKDDAGHQLSATWKLGGTGGWDYLTLNHASTRLYIERMDRIMVVDTASGKVLAEVPEINGAHGVALAEDLGKGFATSGRSKDVVVFDLKTNKVEKRIPTGDGPDATLYDSASHRVYTFNGHGKSTTVIDAKTDSPIATIDLGGKPEFAQTDEHGHVYVNVEDTGELAVIDNGSTPKLDHKYKLTGCEEPSGLALDVKNHLLFSGCGNKVMVVSDPKSGKVITHWAIGEGTDAASFDPGTRTAFASAWDGTITSAKETSAGKFSEPVTLTTKKGARTMALDPKSHKLYTVTADYGDTPEPTAENPHPRPAMLPDSFVVLVYSPK